MIRQRFLTLFVAAFAAAEAQGQSGGLKSVIDQGVAELARRQSPDGSYGDLASTAQAVLAFAESPRAYGDTDGPFMRRAVDWLEQRLDATSELTAADLTWLGAAAAALNSPRAQKLHERAVQRLAQGSASNLTVHSLAATTEQAAAAELADLLAPLAGDPGPNRAAVERLFCTLPDLVKDVAARYPDLKLATTTGASAHWSPLISGMVMGATQAPAGFEEASPARLAGALRVLSVCLAHEPKSPQGAGAPPTAPAGTPRKVGADLQVTYREAALAALQYLDGEVKDGAFGFMGRPDPGITALTLSAVLRTSKRLGQPAPVWVNLGLDWLTAQQKENGSIHTGGLAVYVTSACVLALTDAGRAKDRPVLEHALQFLKVIQRDEAEGFDPNKDWGYGGIGYGDQLRPDLSNTQFGLEALHAGGTPASDPAMQKAILFLQRCQNNPETNAQPIQRADGRIVQAGSDGGAGYHPGESKAGLIDRGDGTFESRSYGSMTYALLKCYLFAGLSLDDPRVKTALQWIAGHWTVDLNPGFDPKSAAGAEYQGLFYYYFTMAKALDASGLETVKSPDDSVHRWRDELLRRLLEASMTEGFWTNQKSDRWMEEFPVLATAYALVAMDHCHGSGASNDSSGR